MNLKPKPIPAVAMQCWASVFKTEGREWMSYAHMSLTSDEVMRKVNDDRERIPHWFRDNEFIGIFQVNVEMIPGTYR